jgi:DNA primase
MGQSFVPFVEVKRAVSIEALLEHYGLFAALTAKGQNLVGACPFCKGPSARQFQVNPEKNAWYCFGCKQGGNVLDFVARRERVSLRAAALKLDAWFALGLATVAPVPIVAAAALPPRPAPEPSPPTTPACPPAENPPLTFTLKTLDPGHANLAVLGLAALTIQHFGAGYCTKGLLKSRLAIPLHNGGGELVAYAGLTLEPGTMPRYLFPPKFNPALEVFNLYRVAAAGSEGRLYVTPDIEGALRLFDAGARLAIGLFDGSLSPKQEEAIADELGRLEGLVLVGEGFADRTVARLARHASVCWIAGLSCTIVDEE